jgi:hypothetical protein
MRSKYLVSHHFVCRNATIWIDWLYHGKSFHWSAKPS